MFNLQFQRNCKENKFRNSNSTPTVRSRGKNATILSAIWDLNSFLHCSYTVWGPVSNIMVSAHSECHLQSQLTSKTILHMATNRTTISAQFFSWNVLPRIQGCGNWTFKTIIDSVLVNLNYHNSHFWSSCFFFPSVRIIGTCY